MANMSLGGYTFIQNPIRMTIITPDLFESHVLTYSSYGYFSWGNSIIGKDITIGWDYIPSDMFDTLNTKYQADEVVIFDPQDGEGKTYNSRITKLEGEYWIFLQSNSSNRNYRKNVTLNLLILEEI